MQLTRQLCGLALACLAVPALAVQGNPAAGRTKFSMCLGCHGIADYKTTFPSVYHVPKLGGQHPDYVVRALQAYRAGERSHPSMKGLVETLSEQDMADIAAFVGGQK